VIASSSTSDPAVVRKGAYILEDASAEPHVIVIATGSEVGIALQARTELEAQGIPARVVSAPCLEWFDEQPRAYRDEVLPPTITARIAIEAGIAQGWWKYVGTDGRVISIEHFGASAAAGTLYKEFGLTTEAIVTAATEMVK